MSRPVANGSEAVTIAPLDAPFELKGLLGVPEGARGLVIFAHGSGSGRHSPRNTHVAEGLRREGLATLLIDLLTVDEEKVRANVFDIALLSSRLIAAARWAGQHPDTRGLTLGYFGASTGAGAALLAAASPDPPVAAVVSRGGRPDLAGADALERVRAPTLLIVGGRDEPVIELNRAAMKHMRGAVDLVIVPGAGHLFEEPGTLDRVIDLAAAWFRQHFEGAARAPR
ncbi:dienelactone hydrolase family protein [Pedomonas sp. V897]|uniref:dienelactone hydrolase family protein n=1 Tax=Pedomonas sp. V897 TaxID=3446482 RepID=UPI003EDF788D